MGFSERVTKIIKQWRDGYGITAEEASDLAEAALDEIDRLRPAVEFTGDGVPIVPRSKVYYIDPVGYIQGLDVGRRMFATDSTVPSDVYTWPRYVYSTHEAAEAAREANHAPPRA